MFPTVCEFFTGPDTGHVEIVRRGSKLFELVYIYVLCSIGKDRRVDSLRSALLHTERSFVWLDSPGQALPAPFIGVSKPSSLAFSAKS